MLEREKFTPEAVERKVKLRAGILPKLAVLGVSSFAAIGLVSAENPVCEKSDALEPFLAKIEESGFLKGQAPPFSGTEKDLPANLQQALEEHFQKSTDQGKGCIIEIGK